MLLQDKTGDYVIASGHHISVRDFVGKVEIKLEMQLEWWGSGLNEKAYWIIKNGEKCIVSVDPEYYQPTEVETLLDDATKAHKHLG